MTELKECPFCGSTDLSVMKEQVGYVKCNDCHASVFDDQFRYDTRAAEARWNHRKEI